jgi:predicted nuclease with TOPRIM domain
MTKIIKDDTISVSEFHTEKEKLLNDQTALNERLQALNAERERVIQQLTMIAGALQTVNHFIDKIDPEVDLDENIDLSETDKAT